MFRFSIAALILITLPTLAFGEINCKFSSLPRLKPVYDLPAYKNAGPYDPGDYERKLLDPFSVECGPTQHTVPVGTVFNGASIPRGAWTLLGTTPLEGSVLPAAIVHDDMCERVLRTSDEVHKLFYFGLLASGVSRLNARVMYASVLAYGPQWNKPGGPVTRPNYASGTMNLLAYMIRRRVRVVPNAGFSEIDKAVKKGTIDSMEFRKVKLPRSRGPAGDQLEIEAMVQIYGKLPDAAGSQILKKITAESKN